LWDPDSTWRDHRFERRSQSFPDVRLVTRRRGTLTTAVGIELKGWYLLAREGEPSFRYAVSPDACADHDLLVIVPWHLKNVLFGHPVVYTPYIESARYAALVRNYWGEFVRKAKTDPRVVLAAGVTPYPAPKIAINDKAVADSGGNFGRVARQGLDDLDRYVEETLMERVAGIEARHWITFFKAFTGSPSSRRSPMPPTPQRSGGRSNRFSMSTSPRATKTPHVLRASSRS
jgi:hypothetical protein